MKESLRVFFFKWVSIHTTLIFLAVSGALMLYNQHEVFEHPHGRGEEREELLLMLGGLVALMPVALLAALWISKRLLQPVQAMAATAEAIQLGDLTKRVETPLADDELGRLGRAINHAFDCYQESLDRLDRFALDASHQFRTPLAAMRAAGEVCLQYERAPAEYRETMGAMLEEADRLSRIVDQLLTLARVSHRQMGMALQPVDLASLLADLAEEFQPVSEEKCITLHVQSGREGIHVLGVVDLLRDAVYNLLDNALRYTPIGGRVEVSLQVDLEAGHVRLAVGDSGPGLSVERRAQVLRPFRRGESSGQRDGHGLGLAIAADIAEAHGGGLEIGVSPLGGAEFTLLQKTR